MLLCTLPPVFAMDGVRQKDSVFLGSMRNAIGSVKKCALASLRWMLSKRNDVASACLLPYFNRWVSAGLPKANYLLSNSLWGLVLCGLPVLGGSMYTVDEQGGRCYNRCEHARFQSLLDKGWPLAFDRKLLCKLTAEMIVEQAASFAIARALPIKIDNDGGSSLKYWARFVACNARNVFLREILRDKVVVPLLRIPHSERSSAIRA